MILSPEELIIDKSSPYKNDHHILPVYIEPRMKQQISVRNLRSYIHKIIL